MQSQDSQTESKKIPTSQKNINSNQLMRLKSHQEQNGQKKQLISGKLIKTRSSTGRRPLSAMKHTQKIIIPSNSTNKKSQLQVKQLVTTALTHNPRIKQFMKQNRLSESWIRQKLFSDDIFTLALTTCISNRAVEEANSAVEHAIIQKVNKMLQKQKQNALCVQIQNKIQQMIEKRLKNLQK